MTLSFFRGPWGLEKRNAGGIQRFTDPKSLSTTCARCAIRAGEVVWCPFWEPFWTTAGIPWVKGYALTRPV